MAKKALITGASRGIGKSVCKELLHHGYDIAGVSRTMIFDEEMMELATSKGLELLAIKADISSLDEHTRIKQTIEREFGYLDLLVNNAGVAPEHRLDILEMSPESYHRVMNINLFGPVFLTQTCFPLLAKSPLANIVFVTSISAVTASDNRAEYCMSKAGLSMYSQVLAKRLAREKVRVFEVRPGVIKTDMIRLVQDKYETMVEQGLFPAGRLGNPEDIAKVIRALVSGDFEYANSSIIEVSGGMQIRSL